MDRKNDIFSEIVKDKLTNYSLPVDNGSWDKIEERLNQASGKKKQRLWISAISVAASIALFIFLLYPFNKKVYNHETATLLSGNEETIIQDVHEEEIVQPALQQNVEHPAVFRKFQSGTRLAENKLTDEVIIAEEIPEENSSDAVKEETTVPENNPVSVKPFFDFEEKTPMPVTKRKKRQSIRLSFGSGGNLLAENNKDLMSYEKNVIPEFVYFRAATQAVNDSKTNDILSYENYQDISHHLPLSLGLTIKKELNRTFSIESGIVYTFLETTFSKEFTKSTADLQLHYLGIPLNVHTRLFGDRLSQWELYLSAGGMAEKGIQSHFVQKNFNIENVVYSVTSNEKIKGFQWSVSISPGIDYRIYRNYSIYLEPKVSYYFDNDQPVSARTKHPLVIGVNAGLRYTWK